MTRTMEYYAGFFDGEGCITIERKNLRIVVGGTYRPILEDMKADIGGNIHVLIHDHPRYKDAWTWHCYNDTAEKFLESCLPYFSVKKAEALKALEFWRHPNRLNISDEYREAIKRLRRKP